MTLGELNEVSVEERVPPSRAGLRSKVIHGLRWNLIGTVGIYLLRAVRGIILARLLMPEDYGLTAIAVTALALLSLLVGMGFGAALIQKDTKDISRYADASFWAILVVSIVLVVATSFAVPWLARFYKDTRLEMIFYVMLVGFLLRGVGAVPESLVYRDMQFKHYNILRFVVTIFVVVFAVIMVVSGWGYWSLIIPTLVELLLMTIANMCIVKWYPRFHFSWSTFKGICTFGFTLMFSRILNFLSRTGTNLLLGKLLSVSVFGHLTFARNQSQVPAALMLQQYYNVAYSAFSRLQSDRPRLLKRYYEAASALTFIMIPILAIGIVLADPLIPAVFGFKWNAAVFPFQMFVVFSLISVFSSLPGILSQTIGRPEFTLYTNCVRVPLNIGGLCLLAYQGKGMHQMVVFLVAAHALINIPFTLFMWWHLRANVSSLWKSHGPSLYLSLLIMILVLFIKNFAHNFGMSVFVTLGLCVVGGGGLYFLLSSWLNPEGLHGLVNLVRSISGIKKRNE